VNRACSGGHRIAATTNKQRLITSTKKANNHIWQTTKLIATDHNNGVEEPDNNALNSARQNSNLK